MNSNTVTLSPIHSNELDIAAQLYEAAFPPIERRDTNLWKMLEQEEPLFHLDAIRDANGQWVGFISYWTFSDFVYVEHFAIEPTCRGNNMGGNAIDALLKKTTVPIVLEVELPTDSLSRRRIAFYQKHGLSLIEEDYLQPPYREGYEWLPLYIMCSHADFAHTHFAHIVDTLRKQVYGVKSK